MVGKRTRKNRAIPNGAIVSVKQDPYSPMFLTNVNTASNVMTSGDPRFGGAATAATASSAARNYKTRKYNKRNRSANKWYKLRMN